MSAENEAEDHCIAHHVEEGDELRQLVGQVVASQGTEAATCYRRFSQLVTKYQEQSQLLDPLLEDLVKPLAGLLLRFALDFDRTASATMTDTSRFLWLLSTVRGYKVVLRFFPNEVANFEPVVALLGRLNQVEDERSAGASCVPSVWEAQYVLLLWLSMLVLIPFHLSLVDSSLASTSEAAAQPPPPATPPPAGAAADAAQPPSTGAVSSSGGDGQAAAYPPIVGSILDLCRGYLGSAGSVREMAAVVVGRLVTRPDMRGALEEWLGWGCAALQQGGAEEGPRGSFRVLGAALAFCTIFKLGKRDALLAPAARVLPAAVDLLGSPAASSNALTRKLAVKLVQRIGLVFLRPRLAAWRYRKGRSALLGGRAAHATEGPGQQQCRQHAGMAAPWEEEEGPDHEAEEDVEHAEQIEGVVEVLLAGLGDRDTVVRWCAAKGIGRLTGRLPRDLAEDVVASVLGDFFTPGASDTAWHGGCLAVAELSRRGLLLPERLPAVAPLVVRALEYDIRRGPCSVGAHVRDAAAYVCWAFARAYTPEALGGAAGELAPALITLACCDREVNCRRAAAAAYQECVGRLGSFPHGIQILTAADYFTVSTRSTAYLTVAPYVAGFLEYFEPLARHLLRVKLRHWEKALRELAAQALAALVPHRPAFFVDTALPALLPLATDHVLEVRHGAVAGVAELLPALRAQGVVLGPELEAAVADVVPAMERSKVTRGKGGEVMRSAICRLIETTSAVGIPLSSAHQSCLYAQLLDNLRHSSPDIQRAAAAALGTYAGQYLQKATPEALEQSTAQFLGDLRDALGSPPAKRGAALALGALPRWLLEPLQEEVLACLAAAAEEADLALDVRDAETRVNAIRALGQVSLVLSGHPGSVPQRTPREGQEPAGAGAAGSGSAEDSIGATLVALSPGPLQRICRTTVEPMLRALEDYSTDNRGDVGSWVREEAMEQLSRLMPLLLPACMVEGAAPEQQQQLSLGLPVGSLAARVLLGLLRQSVERISRVREAAARALQVLLPQAAAAGVAGAAEMAAAVCPLHMDGFVMGDALPAVAGLLVHIPMQRMLLEGLAFSIGGLDNQVSVAAGDALAAAVQRVAEEGLGAGQGEERSTEARLLQLAEAFVGLWEEAQEGGGPGAAPGGLAAAARRSRLATPLLATADVLLSRTAVRDALATQTSAAAAAAGVEAGPGAATVDPAAAGAWGVGGRLLACVRGEVRACTDIPRLHLAAGVLCQLADLPQPLKAAALASAMGLLANRYPKVRRYAAEQLYTALLTFESDEWGPDAGDVSPCSLSPDAHIALDLLSTVAWDGPLEGVRPARSRLYQCFGLPEPRLVKRPAAEGAAGAAAGVMAAGQQGQQQGRPDEDVSYQSLIDRAMRGM